MKNLSVMLLALIIISSVGFAVNVTGCMMITNPGSYTLNQSISGEVSTGTDFADINASCIYINQTNVLLDCQGFAISANGSIPTEHAGVAVRSGRGAITIRNCIVSNFEIANVFSDNNTNITITNITSSGSNADYGIVVKGDVINGIIANNTVSQHTQAGIYFITDTNATFTSYNNTAYNNTVGISLEGDATNGTIYSNNLTNNSAGMVLVFGQGYLQARNNYACDNSIYGIFGVTAEPLYLDNNTVCNNQIGMNLEMSVFFLSNNTISGNSVYGVNLSRANLTSFTNDHYYNNSVDLYVENPALEYTYNLTNEIFDNPAGAFENYTNITLYDSVFPLTSYQISWSNALSPLPTNYVSFAQKFLSIENNTVNVSIENISFNYLDSETTGYDESAFVLFLNNSAGWNDTSASLDTSANTLSLSSWANFGTFAILQYIAPNPQVVHDGNDESEVQSISSRIVSQCQGSTLTLSTDQVDLMVSDDSNGAILYSGLLENTTVNLPTTCDSIIRVYGSKPGYRYYSESFDMIRCGSCDTPIEPANETPTNQTNSDGGTRPTNTTSNESRCTSNLQCSNTQRCSAGDCVEITGCGVVSNHTLTPYECGEGMNCPSCGSGYTCQNNMCVGSNLQSDPSGYIGENVVVHATIQSTNGTMACRNCNLSITDSRGVTFSATTDSNGDYRLPLDLVGQYNISLRYGNTPVKQVMVEALPRPNMEPNEPATVGIFDIVASYWWFLLLILLILAYIIYNRQRRSSRKK